MDVKIWGNQGIALEGNKDIEHDVDMEDDDIEYYDNMEDYDEIENSYGICLMLNL